MVTSEDLFRFVESEYSAWSLIVVHPMSDEFNPYVQWLGIQPEDMPADHYGLLGITRFENDTAVIAAAADERMSLVRSYQMGPRASATQKLLNELAAARVCLLNPGAKSSYDQVLEAVHGTPQATFPPPPFAVVAEPPVHQVEAEPIADERERAGANTWVAAAALFVVLVLGSAIIGLVLYQREMSERTTQSPPDSSEPFERRITIEPRYEEREPILLYQEANGSINFDASFAQLHGPTIQLGVSGSVNVLTDWESMDDWVSWRFKVVKVPPQGIFHVRVTYAARTEADGGKFVIVVGDQEKECEIRGTGEVVTDEYFLAVPNSGDHTLSVRARSKPAERLMTLKSVNFAFP